MSDVELVLAVALGAWLAVLTLVVLLLVRQLGLITVRIEHGAPPVENGLMVGREVVDEVLALLPAGLLGPHYLLFLASNCGPCATLAPQLADREFASDITAFVFGPPNEAKRLMEFLGERIPVVGEPEASAAASALEIRGTPFLMEVTYGIVSGKSIVRDADDLERLVGAHAYSDAEDIARLNREVLDRG